MTRAHTVIDSPVGPLTLVGEDNTLCGLYMEDQSHLPPAGTFGENRQSGFDNVRNQLAEYFEGRRKTFDIDCNPAGNAFQQEVWSVLGDIPFGETVTYGEIAARIGRPGAARTVGAAIGRNPICIVVPCHRVVGASGKLTGYAGGLDRKEYLLRLEAKSEAPTLFR